MLGMCRCAIDCDVECTLDCVVFLSAALSTVLWTVRPAGRCLECAAVECASINPAFRSELIKKFDVQPD